MKKFFLILASIAVLSGSMLAASDPAMAKHNGGWHKKHHRVVCRTVVKKKVVWRNHHRHVVRYKVRRCW